MSSFAGNKGSTRARPVKYSAGPVVEACSPPRVICWVEAAAAAGLLAWSCASAALVKGAAAHRAMPKRDVFKGLGLSGGACSRVLPRGTKQDSKAGTWMPCCMATPQSANMFGVCDPESRPRALRVRDALRLRSIHYNATGRWPGRLDRCGDVSRGGPVESRRRRRETPAESHAWPSRKSPVVRVLIQYDHGEFRREARPPQAGRSRAQRSSTRPARGITDVEASGRISRSRDKRGAPQSSASRRSTCRF